MAMHSSNNVVFVHPASACTCADRGTKVESLGPPPATQCWGRVAESDFCSGLIMRRQLADWRWSGRCRCIVCTCPLHNEMLSTVQCRKTRDSNYRPCTARIMHPTALYIQSLGLRWCTHLCMLFALHNNTPQPRNTRLVAGFSPFSSRLFFKILSLATGR